jgi:ribosomal protein S6--L-glutamate ligase
MNIVILAKNANLYSHQRLLAAGRARGHRVRIINTATCYMNIASSDLGIHCRTGDILEGIDAVIPRIGASLTHYGCAVVRQFEAMGTYSLNSSIGITRSRDKLRSLQLLSRKGIGMPITGFANSPKDVDDLIKMVGGAPLVIKLLEGTQGVGVVLAENKHAAESVIQAFLGLKANIIVQEYIKESKGADIRCLVIGDKVVASMRRQGPPGEFRSNLHRGGSAEAITITEEEYQTAINAAKVMGLNVAGVDLLRSDRGPLVMEVNSSPGLRGIEESTGKDIAGMIIQYIEEHAKPITEQSQYEG